MNKHLSSYFDDFLSEIRPQDEETSAYKEAHKTLRDRLTANATSSPSSSTPSSRGAIAARRRSGQKV